jgi:hypothetical protein
MPDGSTPLDSVEAVDSVDVAAVVVGASVGDGAGDGAGGARTATTWSSAVKVVGLAPTVTLPTAWPP